MVKPGARVPTSLDVARRAGVSRALVSGVLNDTMSTMRVSPATRQRVLDAAAELGYTPNPVARALRRQRSNVIGFLPRTSRQTPYEHPVPFLLGIHIAREAMKRGYHILEASAAPPSERQSGDVARFLRERRVDGVILDSPQTAIEVAQLVESGFPVIQLIRPQPGPPTTTIVVDPAPGTDAAIAQLVARGHERIAFIGAGGDHPVDRDRLACFHAALARHDIAPDDRLVCLTPDYDIERGRAQTGALLALAQRPTAIFAAGDNLALGVLQALYEAGIRVPDAMSVVSYDDIFAGQLIPPLSSVSQPLEAVASRAIEALIAQVEQPDGQFTPRHIALPTGFTARGSVRQVPAERRPT